MNSEDKLLFLDAMDDVKPLKNKSDTQWLSSPRVRSYQPRDSRLEDNPFTTDFLERLPLNEPLNFKRDGIQQGVLDKLRRGKYPREVTLNLLRLTVEQCRQALFLALLNAEQQGVRNLLIIHGKGLVETSHPNIIRSFLNRWLQEYSSVQAFCCAVEKHGGSGACYVGLKKSEHARNKNREIHGMRSC